MNWRNAIMGAFLADAYSLGAHWIYDEDQLKKLDCDWNALNAPAAMWHKGKKAGDFTHYGDHMLWLLEYIKEHNGFDVDGYAAFWCLKMQSYTGYVDGSSRDTLEHLNAGKSPCEGVENHDLSICGRIAPLLLVSDSCEVFVQHAQSFAKLTHNDPVVLEAVHFFASLIYRLSEGAELIDSMQTLAVNYTPKLQEWVRSGIASKDKSSFEVIRAFGPACGVDGGFAGTIHLLSKYNTLDSMMKANAQAGGDSSARGMIAGMLIALFDDPFKHPLAKHINVYDQIVQLLDG